MISDGLLRFDVVALEVTIEEGVKIVWEGREIDSGPVAITLGQPGSNGTINYLTGEVDVEFRVRIRFDELCEALSAMGADPDMTRPLDAVIRSHGSVFDDHSLRLAGHGEVAEHRLFDPDQTHIDVRAPSQ